MCRLILYHFCEKNIGSTMLIHFVGGLSCGSFVLFMGGFKQIQKGSYRIELLNVSDRHCVPVCGSIKLHYCA